MNNDRAEEYGRMIGMIYICNFPSESLEKYEKAIKESRAIGRVTVPGWDKKGRITFEEGCLYFKTRVEYQKYLHVLNCINSNEPYSYHNLDNIDTNELLDEINLRLNKEKM